MNILLVGETHRGSRTPQRAQALRDLGHTVTEISTSPAGRRSESRPGVLDRVLYRLRLPLDRRDAGAAMARAAGDHDLLILDNARAVRPSMLRAARRAAPQAPFVWFSEDDMLNRIHRTRWIERSVALFDLCVTTKSFNARPEEMPALGARRVLFVNNTYCPHQHFSVPGTTGDGGRWGAPISFVGTYEKPRAEAMLDLAQAGLPVRIWGNGWNRMRACHPNMKVENRPVYGEEYRWVVGSSAINLCFLRHGNRDRQTCRSIEIPAMGGFMMHEYSEEMAALIVPDREAVYFRDTAELIERCRSWSCNAARQDVAAAGHRRVTQAGFSHAERWRFILEQAMAGK